MKISGFLCAEARRRNDASFSGQAIIAIAQMAYGWMPTMLNQVNIIKSAKHDDWCAFFDAADVNGFDDAIAFIDGHESPPIGATWVGASKALHFVNSEVFPIWDSNVARALASEDCKTHHYHMKDKKRFLCYARACYWMLEQPEISKEVGEVRKLLQENDQCGKCVVSRIRALEFTLFVLGKRMKQQDRL